MCNTPRAPAPAARLPEAPTPPPMTGETGTSAQARRKRASTQGGTILTSGQGAVLGQVGQKTLLGA